MLIQLLMDNPRSWILPYALRLKEQVLALGHNCVLLHRHEEVTKGEILVLLSCEKVFRQLELNRHNLVVHESALPQGKGWSPLTWQVLEGRDRIPVTLFEAASDVDSGDIYLQEDLVLEGHELVDELREKQGETTLRLVLKFIREYPSVKGRPQQGAESFYPRRKPEHSMLNTEEPLSAQFNLLRVCDNERYPAYFIKDGVKYLIKIYKDKQV
jgi:methionyl-tRNA formyltransferase